MDIIKIQGHAPIFAVDDDPMFQEILEFAYSLSNIDNKMVPLYSGFECLDKLEEVTRNGEPYPSLILMDINMPGMSGIETVGKIRQSKNYEKIPIITMLSSSNETMDIQRSLGAGANAYHEKPANITNLRFEVE